MRKFQIAWKSDLALIMKTHEEEIRLQLCLVRTAPRLISLCWRKPGVLPPRSFHTGVWMHLGFALTTAKKENKKIQY